MSGPARESGLVNARLGLLAVLTCVTLVLTALVLRVPNERRTQAFGNASTGLIVGQGAMLVAADAAADLVTPAVVIVVAGGLGVVATLVLEARSHDPGPGNGERVRTPLKSRCRALRFS